jgi:hypothetical protein
MESAVHLTREMTQYSTKTGCLYVDFRSFGLETVLRFKPWRPDGLTVQRLNLARGVWISDFLDPGLLIVRSPSDEALESVPPVDRFCVHIPAAILRRVAVFRHLQVSLLQVLARSDLALQLLGTWQLLNYHL